MLKKKSEIYKVKFTLREIIDATGAKVLKNEELEESCFDFSTDTRTVKSGEIYLPLKGANFDGEAFIEKAIEAGATGYFCTKETLFEGAKIALCVEDTLIAYLELARYYKRKISPKTVAITGSSGKTTTKEMAFCVSKEKFKTHKSELNFNNEIGLCKTLLSMPEDTEVLVVEMGMRGLGEIELLSKYAEPDISIIANVGTAHIGRLGSRENIAKAKCEIVKFQNPNGVLIAHDDDLIKNLIKLAEPIYFSLNDAKIVEKRVGYSKFLYKNFEYELNIEGDYNVQNALSVIEMGLALNMEEAEIARGLLKYSPIEKRWEVQDVKGFKIINDSYNANPESMKAALKTILDLYEAPLLLILGDMGELGENEAFYHAQIGDFLAENLKSGAVVFTVGELASEIFKKLAEKGLNAKSFKDNKEISRYILDNVKIGTTIVLKASRSMRFEEIIQNLKGENTEKLEKIL